MATYQKFTDFVEQLGLAKHNLNTDVIKAYLTNTAFSLSADAVKADLSESVTGTGYTAGGTDIQNTYTETAGTGTCVAVDHVWTAGAADWTAFQYIVGYNDTQTSPADPLIFLYDYASALTLGNGETFTVDYGVKLFDIA